jgi:hypothetical protein
VTAVLCTSWEALDTAWGIRRTPTMVWLDAQQQYLRHKARFTLPAHAAAPAALPDGTDGVDGADAVGKRVLSQPS